MCTLNPSCGNMGSGFSLFHYFMVLIIFIDLIYNDNFIDLIVYKLLYDKYTVIILKILLM